MSCFSRLSALLVASILLCVAFGPAPIQAQELLYVDADASGAGDGSSWSDAYPNLQDALSAATDDDVIAVATGTYYPDIGDGIPVDDRESSFTITGEKDGLKLYGGYTGDEIITLGNLKLDDRNFDTDETILSGDVDGTPDDSSGNSFHVFYLDGVTGANITPETRIDGFTISSGNADDYDENSGGGVYCDGKNGNKCSPIISNVVFRENSADYGGAFYSDGDDGVSDPSILNVTFIDNQARDDGGAIYNDGYSGESSPLISNTSFTNNTTDSGSGGAVFNDGSQSGESSPVITGVTFTGNSADFNGGAIYNDAAFGTSSPKIANATFNNNTAVYRGGAVNSDAGGAGVSQTKFTEVSFSGNSAEGGGGVHIMGAPILTNVLFFGNSAEYGGGLLVDSEFSDSGEGEVANAVFSGNSADNGSGGAIYVDAGSNPEIGESTFSENFASENGGAIYNGEDSSPKIVNGIFFQNSASGNGNQIFNTGENSEPTVDYSLIEGGCTNIPGSICGDGNLTGDPQFADADGPDDTPGTEDDDLRLQGPGSGNGPSPAIDAGNNTVVPDTLTEDATGEMSRFHDVEDVEDTGNGSAPIVDLGAYESGGSSLPVELANFEAKVEGKKVRLSWQTASETSNAGFEVQRQKEEESWIQVGYVESNASGGTTTDSKSYKYTVKDLPIGNHQFRLRQVDLGGGSELTEPISVSVRMKKAIKLGTVAPNPVSDAATFNFAVKERSETTIQLYDTLGRHVTTIHQGTPRVEEEKRVRIDVSGLPSGTYFLRLETGGRSETQRLTVVQ